jgi:hypothetical protein
MSSLIFKISILITVFLLLFLSVFAQRDTVITQEVEVTKAYRPVISDAFKINETPAPTTEQPKKPNFNYTIVSRPFFSENTLEQLEAAKITGKPKEELGFGHILLGAGNYGKPYGELFLNNRRSNNSQFGIHAKHLSSYGKVKLPGDDKVDAPFSETGADLFFKHTTRSVLINFDAAYNRNGFNYYGYPEVAVPDMLLEKDQDVNYFGAKQVFSKADFGFSIQSNAKAASAPGLGLDVNYRYFSDKTNQQEHQAEVTAHVSKKIKYITPMLDAGAVFYKVDTVFTVSDSDYGRRREFWLKANPAVKLESKGASLRVGGKFYAVVGSGLDAKIKLAPDLLINLMPLKGILKIYAGIDGKYELNSYSKIAYENPFADPFHDVRNTMTQYRFFGGIHGKLTAKTSYKISAEYSSIKDQPFYYLRSDQLKTGDSLTWVSDNTFKVLYDDLGLAKFSLELYHTATEKLNFLLTGNYYSYKNEKEISPWNLPSWETTLKAAYQATPRLNVSSEIYLIGQRKALIKEYKYWDPLSSTIQAPVDKSFSLGTIVDLNAKATYAITGDFSAFAQANNLGFQHYQQWLGYTVQSFNFLAGISYSF